MTGVLLVLLFLLLLCYCSVCVCLNDIVGVFVARRRVYNIYYHWWYTEVGRDRKLPFPLHEREELKMLCVSPVEWKRLISFYWNFFIWLCAATSVTSPPAAKGWRGEDLYLHSSREEDEVDVLLWQNTWKWMSLGADSIGRWIIECYFVNTRDCK